MSGAGADPPRRPWSRVGLALLCSCLPMCVCACACAPTVLAVAPTAASASTVPPQRPSSGLATVAPASEAEAGSLQSAAAKASRIGRAVAMSLIALALAVAGTVLVFRRNHKEAAGVFVIGVVAVVLATPTGISVIRATVASLFGGR